ncbi:condensation domain-containing protein [Rhodococcus sp. NPDC058521]|uniref:condensation domain-containing protein n=1 Tax=Rhodococcus sp. NPDC058521 TaxID=3346536 RepID=UPI00365722BF
MRNVEREERHVFPLTNAQRGLWAAQKRDPGVPFVIGRYIEIFEDIDVAALRRAGRAAAIEYGSGALRIVEVDGEPFQFVDTDLERCVVLEDLTEEPDPVGAAHRWMRAECAAPVAMTDSPLVTSALLRVGSSHYFWYVRAHHVALDGYGVMALVRRTAQIYNSSVTGTVAPSSRAADLEELADLEGRYRSSERFGDDRLYWRDRLSSLSAQDDMCVMATVPLQSTAELSSAHRRDLEVLGSETGGMASVVIAAIATFFAERSGRSDVVLGLRTSGRTSRAMRDAAGSVDNIVPLLLTDVGGSSTEERIDMARRTLLGALRHQRYRFEDMQRDRGAHPAARPFGPVINLMLEETAVDLAGFRAGVGVLTSGPVHDVQVDVYRTGMGALHLDLLGNSNTYTPSELSALHQSLVRFVERFAAEGRRPARRLSLVPPLV